jgi:hypothetical protein
MTINELIKQTVTQLPKKELEKLLIRAAQKHEQVQNYLLINYVDKKFGEEILLEKTRADLEILFRKRHKGFSEELQFANMLAACLKRINEFAKACRNSELELQLVMEVLAVPFNLNSNMFCTCFTVYNYKVYMLLQKAINIFQKKIHEDYRLEYEERLNEYLSIMHRTSEHLDYISNLPVKI